MGEVTKREHSMGLSENTDPESMCYHDFTIFSLFNDGHY